MGHSVRACLILPAAAAMLLWPALWNRYPIVFADTGTYLSQAIHRYAGWDRPVFYSLFIFPLHAMRSLWPVVVVQALLCAWVLRLVARVFVPALPDRMFLLLIAGLAVGTWLPWLVSEVMPDLFTPLLVLTLTLLACAGTGLKRAEVAVLAALTALMIATQQSSVPLSALLIAALVMCRRRIAGTSPDVSAGDHHYTAPPRSDLRHRLLSSPALRLALPPLLAVIALCSVNAAAHGRLALSPFGSVFLLARMLADGPAAEVLQRDCSNAGWRLCAYRDAIPATSDAFLWTADSPLYRAGGPKRLAPEASAIIRATVLAEPSGVLANALRNAWDQVERFASGDGLSPWPDQVTPHIDRDFPPAEAARYAAARQQRGDLTPPWLLGQVHRLVGLGGIAACLILLPSAWRQREPGAGLLLAVLLVIPLSAGITGALSGPHDRYQARIMWLPPFAAALLLCRRTERTP